MTYVGAIGPHRDDDFTLPWKNIDINAEKTGSALECWIPSVIMVRVKFDHKSLREIVLAYCSLEP